jgi:hypothetical protein
MYFKRLPVKKELRSLQGKVQFHVTRLKLLCVDIWTQFPVPYCRFSIFSIKFSDMIASILYRRVVVKHGSNVETGENTSDWSL